MRFMGDAPLKGQSELDVLYTLLKVSPADLARFSLSCRGAQFPHLSTKVAGHRDGKPKEEYILQVGRGLEKGSQAFLQVLTLFLCAWCVAWGLAWPRHVTWPALLQLCGDHEVMRDECYCQVVKQITENTSTKQ